MLVDCLIHDEEISALFDTQAEISAMLEVEAALARAEAKAGLISQQAGNHIAAKCATFKPDIKAIEAGMARDGVAVPELVSQLRDAVDKEFSAFVHKGATSQDIMDSGLMVRLIHVLDILFARLETLTLCLEHLQERDGNKKYIAHTRMQVALPMTVGDKIESWLKPLRFLTARFSFIREFVLAVQLGGPIGNGDSFQSKNEEIIADIAEQLKLYAAEPWQADRTRMVDIANFFALITGTLGKIGQDISLMAQNEIAAIHLSGSGGSSAMAHKQNPVKAEVLVAIARYSSTLVGGMHQAMVHENERSGAAWTLEWLILPPMATAAGSALLLAHELLDGAHF